MEKRYAGFLAIEETEALCVVGGVDKGVQETLYLIGYVVGVIVKVFTSLFGLIKRTK